MIPAYQTSSQIQVTEQDARFWDKCRGNFSAKVYYPGAELINWNLKNRNIHYENGKHRQHLNASVSHILQK
jgi:hypothetical protein